LPPRPPRPPAADPLNACPPPTENAMHPYLPLSFADDLERNARWCPDHPAYVQGERSISHRQLLARGKRLGSALHRAGVRNQDRVGILAMNSIEYGEVIARSEER